MTLDQNPESVRIIRGDETFRTCLSVLRDTPRTIHTDQASTLLRMAHRPFLSMIRHWGDRTCRP